MGGLPYVGYHSCSFSALFQHLSLGGTSEEPSFVSFYKVEAFQVSAGMLVSQSLSPGFYSSCRSPLTSGFFLDLV